MSLKNSPQSIIESYRRKQRMMPFLIIGFAALLLIVGVVILISWISGPDGPSLFSTRTPTATITSTATATLPSPTPSNTPLDTETPTPTLTVTAAGPFEYEVQDGDNCYDLAVTYNLTSVDILLQINGFAAGTCPIYPGQTILIPASWQELPTSTPWPVETFARGTYINYVVQSGDTISSIASYFNTTIESIEALNTTVEDFNAIEPGLTLRIQVNMVTRTPTLGSTSTPGPTATQTP